MANIPPHSLDAEEAVLTALLTAENAYESVVGKLKAEDFYRDQHRIIFEAITNIIGRNIRPDIIVLAEELRRNNKINEAGGIIYINEMTNRHIGDTYNIDEHVKIVASKSKLRHLIDAGNRIISSCYKAEDDAENIVDEAERTILSVTGVSKADKTFSAIGEVAVTNLRRLHDLAGNANGITGIPTSFKSLDKLTRGLQRSDLILIAARPSMGKTAFTLDIAQRIGVRQKKSVAFFSLEMSKEQLVGRVISNLSSIPLQKLQAATLDENDWLKLLEVMQQLSNAPLYIDETPGLTPQQMRSKLRRLKADRGLDLVIVDYIQLMQGRASSSSDNRQQEISEISRNLKLIAKELDVPIIALSQLSRSVEVRQDKRPILSDLRESGSLEQDADIVMFLYREKYYDPMTDKGDVTEILVRKHRNGELGTIQLMFQGEYTRFQDIAYNE